jgi:hypothetical protein
VHVGVVEIGDVDVGDADVGNADVGVGVGDADFDNADVGDVDVGVLLDGVSRLGSLPELLITQSSVVTTLVPPQVSSIPSLIY